MSESFLSPDAFVETARRPAMIDRWSRGVVHRLLENLRDGQVVIEDSLGRLVYGQKTSTCDLSATVRIRDLRAYRLMVIGGFNAFAEAFLDRHWECSDLTALVRIFVRNPACFYGTDQGLARLAVLARRVLSWLKVNNRAASRRDIAAHYDLGNEFFSLFLDETMMYSCGVFEREDSTLRDASIAKNRRICEKLALRPEDHLLEIGTGWGAFAIQAARDYGCRVTTTTLSRRQYEMAVQRVREAGLEDRIRVLNDDYRDLTGRYDKLVSIEMIEAVGHHNLGAYFAKCGELLSESGIAVIQAITIADREYDRARREIDFIKQYVFPGSCIPSVAIMTDRVARRTNLRLFHLEDLTPHYARTLLTWRERLHMRRDDARRLGLTDAFLRLWDLYFSYCEGGFAERHIGLVQLVLTKPLCRRAPIGAPVLRE